MHPIRSYTAVDVGYPYILRGTNQQTNNGLLWLPPTYRAVQRGGQPVTVDTLVSQGAALGMVELQNRSGGTISVGIGVRIPNHLWIAGAWDDDGATPFSADTTDAQDTDASDFPLETTTNNDGYVIASRVPFNAVSIRVGTASDGGSAVRALRYTDLEGDGWATAISNTYAFSGATGNYSTGEQVVVFATPGDWGRVQASGLSGIPTGYYAMNVRATTAPTVTAGSATSIEIFRLYLLTENVTDNTSLFRDFGAKDFVMEGESSGLVAFFGTADVGNRVTALVRTA